MPWIKRQADEHVCDRPGLDGRIGEQADIRIGDIWECEEPTCLRQWIVRDKHGAKYYEYWGGR